MELAASLLHKLYGVQDLLPEVFVGKEAIVENREIILDPQFIRDYFGFQISDDEIKQFLRRLRYEINTRADGQFIVQVPSYRWDVTSRADLVKEFLRVYGADKLLKTKVQVMATGKDSMVEAMKRGN